jgi:hypothetical protein
MVTESGWEEGKGSGKKPPKSRLSGQTRLWPQVTTFPFEVPREMDTQVPISRRSSFRLAFR